MNGPLEAEEFRTHTFARTGALNLEGFANSGLTGSIAFGPIAKTENHFSQPSQSLRATDQLRFFHQGQFEGARVHLPVHLRRRPVEPLDPAIVDFYGGLLATLRRGRAFREGSWLLIAPQSAWAGNATAGDFIAYAWRGPDGSSPDSSGYVVVVNYSNDRGRFYLRLPFREMAGGRFRLTDEMGSEVYEREGDDLVGPGLYIDLEGWRYNVFRLDRGVP
jgi:hypothetical protein